MKKHKVVSILLLVCMLFTMTPAIALADTSAEMPDTKVSQTFPDMAGHWAANAVSKWAGLGIVKGDDKGFRPNDSITRAELAVILDNLMDYQTEADNPFADVKSGAWYADAVLKANAAGILNGDGSGNALANAKVTREQAAVMLARAFGVDESDGEKTAFKDASAISSWAKSFVFGMEDDQYIGGMGNGNFEPKANITRAQVVTMIDNAVKAYYTTAGTYTEDVAAKADGANSVTIVSASDIIIKDATISGDLIVAEGVGTGDFTLDHTTVTGKLIARGGGENSIHILNGAEVHGRVTVERVGGVVRIVSNGVVIEELDADTDVILEGKFTNVVVEGGASVEVRGQVARLRVTEKAAITATKDAQIETMIVGENAQGTNVNIDENAVIKTLDAEADMTTSGGGTPKSISGTGSVTDKEAGTSTGSSTSGGSGSNGNNGTTDKRSISFEDDYNYTTIIKGNNSWGDYVYLEGTDSSGNDCDALSMGAITVKNKDDGSPLDSSAYNCVQASDYIIFLPTYINQLTEGKHNFEISVKASDGKIFALDYTIYIVPTEATILYDQPQYGTLEINESTSGTLGDLVPSGGAIDIAGNKHLNIKLTGLPSDKRIKSVLITDSYYGYSETDDYTKFFIEEGAEISYSPRGTATIQVITDDVPSSLPEIVSVELYLDYDYDTETYSQKVTGTVPSMEASDESFLYAKVLLADGQTTEFANYVWQVQTENGAYEDIYSSTEYDCMWLYEAGSAEGHTIKLTVSGYEKQSQGSADTTIYVDKALKSQSEPNGLTVSAISSAAAADGKIGNTTTDMEYKRVKSYDGKTTDYSDSGYVTCSAGNTSGLVGGTYYVRYKVKTGYLVGYPATVIIAMNQAAPTGLVGVKPTSLSNIDAQISNTTTAMEWKRSGESSYYSCSDGVTTIFTPTTYYVRYKAVDGYYAGADAVITIGSFANQDQTAPTGLETVAPTHATGSDGKIKNTTSAMEYRLSSDSSYTACDDGQTSWLPAGIYYVRLKAKTGFNASLDTTVTITAPAANTDATLQSLSYICTYDGSQEQSSVTGFDPSTTTYDISLYGNVYGKTFNLNPYAGDPGYATVSYSAVTVGTGEYTAVLKAEVTAEDGMTKQTYTVNITVERRSGTSSISPNTYSISSDTVPVVTLSLTDRDGNTCSLADLLGSTGSVTMIDQMGDTIGSEYYTMNAANSTFTIKKEYFSDRSVDDICYFHVSIVTKEGYSFDVQRVKAPYVTITN